MKYVAEVSGNQLNLDLEERDGRVRVRVDDRDYEVTVATLEPGVYLLFIGDAVHEARVADGGSQSLDIKVDGHPFRARVIDRKSRGIAFEHSDPGRQLLVAPMPGKVVRVLLQPGDDVAAGQGVVVVEAMKMQNEVKSSKKGKVVEIRVSPGEAVNANQVLAIVE
jgi:biotin carboxyl carrier protein